MRGLRMYNKNILFLFPGILLLSIFFTFGCETPVEDFGEDTALMFNPSSAVIPGSDQSADVDVVVENAIGLITARFTISFNSSLLEVSNIKTTGNGFIFHDAGATVNSLENTYDNKNGIIVVGVGGIMKGFTGAQGDGILATITFKSKSSGSDSLFFVDSEPNDIFMSQYSSKAAEGWVEQTVLKFNGSITVE